MRGFQTRHLSDQHASLHTWCWRFVKTAQGQHSIDDTETQQQLVSLLSTPTTTTATATVTTLTTLTTMATVATATAVVPVTTATTVATAVRQTATTLDFAQISIKWPATRVLSLCGCSWLCRQITIKIAIFTAMYTRPSQICTPYKASGRGERQAIDRRAVADRESGTKGRKQRSPARTVVRDLGPLH